MLDILLFELSLLKLFFKTGFELFGLWFAEVVEIF